MGEAFRTVARAITAYLKHEMSETGKGTFIYFECGDDPDDPECVFGGPREERPQWESGSWVWPSDKLAPPPPSPPAPPPPPPPPTPRTVGNTTPTRTKKRKGKTPAPNQPYEIKRQLSDEEARKIASSFSVDPTATGAPPRTEEPPSATPPPPAARKGKGKLPSQDEAFQRHLAATSRKGPSPRPKSTSTSLPTNPDATTRLKTGVVVHGIALRKDLGKVRQWLEAANKELGKITGIRWLRKKTMLVEEGKKTSSAVVYLEKETEVERVRLGGRWLRSDRYESERGRK